jgi:hypothetical protein
MLVGGGCSAESYSSGIRNFAEKGISQGANCQVFAPAVFAICRAPLETSFVLLQRYLIYAEQSPYPHVAVEQLLFPLAHFSISHA